MDYYLNILIQYYTIWIIIWFCGFLFALSLPDLAPLGAIISVIFLIVANFYGHINIDVTIVGYVLFIVLGTMQFGILFGRDW